MRCVWLGFCPQPSTLVRIAEPSQFSSALMLLTYLLASVKTACSKGGTQLLPSEQSTTSASTNYKHIFIDIVLRVFVPAQHDALRLGQQDILAKFGIDKGLDVLCRAP